MDLLYPVSGYSGRAFADFHHGLLGVQPVLSKAGERIRTVDIHVGNVTDTDSQTPANQPVTKSAPTVCSKYAANRAGNSPPDPALAALIEAWPTLPDAIKRAILAMIDACG